MNRMRACIAALAAATASALVAPPARACGGCFHPPTQATVVTGHRMVFSVSQQQSVLWDQIEYSGSPEDFAWILPVRSGATVQLSHEEFFAALDAITNTVITGPTASCGGSSSFGCGASATGSASLDFAGTGAGGVQVLSASVVGPYDTVTVHSTDPNALYDWLNANGYVTPDAMRPTIDAYVQGGFDFIALRLAPGQGVQAMQPVRVVTQGGGLTLPLRMVAAGVGADVNVTLYVIGDGRYEAQNFPNGLVDPSKLVWLHAQNQSNYETLAEQVMQAGGGTWLTEYAAAGAVGTSTGYGRSCSCAYPGVSCYGSATLQDAYLTQCTCLPVSSTCPEAGAAATDAASDGAAADGSAEASAYEAGADGSSDASPSVDASSAGPPDASCASVPACDAFDDADVALVGLDPSTAWITRLRTILPSGALANDLMLQASATQTGVSNHLTASVYDDPSYSPCSGASGGGGGCSVISDDGRDPLGPWLIAGSLGLVAFSLLRRRARR